jgi:hypothetical protein
MEEFSMDSMSEYVWWMIVFLINFSAGSLFRICFVFYDSFVGKLVWSLCYSFGFLMICLSLVATGLCFILSSQVGSFGGPSGIVFWLFAVLGFCSMAAFVKVLGIS